jgi:D-alanyl-lipoteichoic acid acyltransferase DltB (MBOAT superfamily)
MTTYGFGIWLDQAESAKTKRILLWSGVATNVLILVGMKYLPFLSENLKAFSALLSLDTQIQPVKAFVSVGVSYYVFQAISYLFDIELEIEKPERHFGLFFLYLAFFPKLLQGPIERASDLIPQLKIKYEFNYDNMRFGMLLFTWGLFKKTVIADRLGMFVDPVFDNVAAYQGLSLIIATYFYAFQIFMDFSGYTDMALGSARLFNINLTQNFNTPYLATSIADFWRRWHISFSRWILDYIFKPLQMEWRNWKNWGTATALIVAFLISGIWHGASWGFVIWGGLHGFYMAFSLFYKPYQKKLHKMLSIEKTKLLKVLQIAVTFNLVCLAWVFFRTKNLDDAWYIITHLLSIEALNNSNGSLKKYILDNIILKQSVNEFILVFISLILVMIVSILMHKNNSHDVSKYFNKCNLQIRWVLYSALIISIIVFAVYGSGTFIYYQF